MGRVRCRMRAARPAIPMAPGGTTRFTSISASRESPLSPSGERVREGGAEEDNSPRLECVRRGGKGLGRGRWGGAGVGFGGRWGGGVLQGRLRTVKRDLGWGC